MRILIIRHGDPDYAIDGLTEKGKREVALLTERLAGENLTAIYCSPLGRARATIAPTLERLGRKEQILPFLREFNAKRIRVPYEDGERECWDLLPEFVEEHPILYSPDRWREADFLKNTEIPAEYDRVCAGLDELLAAHGYRRDGLSYRVLRPNHDTLALVCHFGVTAVLLSHLFNCSPYSIWQNAVTLPTSVTTLYTEERCEGRASFRCAGIGDLSHLFAGGEAPSFAARFCECFADECRH